MNRREHRAVVQAYRNSTLSGATHQQAMGVLTQAAQQAIQGGPQAVQRFMQAQGFPQDGAWCGEFAAAVVRSTGSRPPNHPEVASNWRNFGTPSTTPHAGDVAVRRATGSYGGRQVSTGSTGSHVTFVGGVDPRTGTFTGVGGNQGASRNHPTSASQYPVSGYDFRTPLSSATATTNPMPTPIPGSDRAQLASGTPSSSLIRQSDVNGAAQAMNASNQTPYQDIPFAVPPSMPNNVPPAPTPAAAPTPGGSYSDQSLAVPQPTSVPAPQQWIGSDVSPGISIGNSVPQSLDPNFSIDYSLPQGDYGSGQYFNSVTGTYQDTPLGTDASASAQGSTIVGDPNAQASASGNASVGDPNAQASAQGQASVGDPNAQATAQGSASVGADPATQDFYAANNLYGEGGWYYDQNGTIQPNDSFAGASATYQSSPTGGTIGGTGAAGGTVGGQGTSQTLATYTPAGINRGYTPFGSYSASGFGGSGFNGYGQMGQAAGPAFSPGGFGVDTSTLSGLSHGGVDPTGDSGPPPGQGLEGLHSTTIGVSESAQSGGGEANDAADAALMAAKAAAPRQYPLTWGKWKNPFPSGGFQQRGGPNALDPVYHISGGWYPTSYTTDPSLQTTMPGSAPTSTNSFAIPTPGSSPQPPQEHLAHGGAIDIAQWMSRKSGKVPGVDHGRDEVNALLEPGEIVVNRSQMRGLKIGKSKLLRSDQRKAIKQAQHKKAA